MENIIKGYIFNIEKYHLNDGEGIRTLVFLKGCPCYCPWCNNPESQNLYSEIAIYEDKCSKCGNCVKYCLNKSNKINNNKIIYDKYLCKACGNCVKHCNYGARELIGKEVFIEDVIREIEKDIIFYRRSEGGVTLSGGEPCLQPFFSNNILKICKTDLLINTAIETSGCCDWNSLYETVEYADEVLFDIKQTDPELFEKYICSSIKIVDLKTNIKKLVSHNKNVIFRYPLIPGFTDDEKNINNIINWAHEFGIKRVDILPFHQYGRKKYKALDLNYLLENMEKAGIDKVEEYKRMILHDNLECLVGG